MPTFKRIEEIIAWQLADKLCSETFRVAAETGLSNDFRLRSQICASSESIKSNIAEGFGRAGNREFIRFLHIANGSCAEHRSQLTTLLDRDYINEAQFNGLHLLSRRTGKAIYGLIKYLEQSNLRGPGFRYLEP